MWHYTLAFIIFQEEKTMIKKGLFKAVKMFAVAAIMALGVMAGAGMSGESSTFVTAYAQEYYDSSDYHLNYDDDGVWRCYNSAGQLDTEYDGIVENEYGWWKVTGGCVDFNYNDLAQNEYGWWKVSGGCVDFNYNDLAQNEYGWWKVTNGRVDFSYNGLAQNEYGWWKVTNGCVDFSCNDLVQNEYGWWYVINGKVDFDYNGLAHNEQGWWKISGGSVDFDANGLIYDEATDTWWYFNGGRIDFSYTGLAENDYGEWKIYDGKVDFSFTGVVYDNDIYWYVLNGCVNKNYTGTCEYDGYTYDVVNGRCTRRKNTEVRNVKWYDLDGSYIGKDSVTVEVDNHGNMVDDYYYSGYMLSREYNSHGGYLFKICIGSLNGPEYRRDALLKKGNLNLRDYDGDVSLYYVKVNKL